MRREGGDGTDPAGAPGGYLPVTAPSPRDSSAHHPPQQPASHVRRQSADPCGSVTQGQRKRKGRGAGRKGLLIGGLEAGIRAFAEMIGGWEDTMGKLSDQVYNYPEGLGEVLYREQFDFNAEPPWEPS
ncbi:hypothetical protein KIL84_011745 [Mauremys mutica]|uniref:Uncharacterized protein n=1 Tax=Mauremys mutica TaxID=74926 RepID=A0A9D3XET9_9SAUR|nr:hypothetical protein KIL84_011745 [Mauremys mutica]